MEKFIHTQTFYSVLISTSSLPDDDCVDRLRLNRRYVSVSDTPRMSFVP